MTENLVSFVVLNWNGIEDTLTCIDSINNQSHKNFEIIVVDNGSEVSQKERLKTLPDIRLIDLPKNTGFTGGQLAAYNIAKGEYIALINNDCVIAVNWCERALKLFRDGRKIAAIGGRAYDWNESNGDKPFLSSKSFYSHQVVNPITGHSPTLRTGKTKTSVSSISGAAVMISREAIEKVGYFDKRFFAYYEETDLFARMKRAGYLIIYNPSLETWHKIAQSTRSNPGFYLYFMHRNRFMFAVKNYDNTNLWKFIRYYFLREWVGALLHVSRKTYNSDIEQKMLVRAGIWNILHLLPTLKARQKVQKLGSTYTKLLDKDASEDVSIIIPCYNYAQYVAEAIGSAASQSLQPSEIVVIDDGSTDGSAKVIKNIIDRLAIKYPSIEFSFLTQENSGIVATKNRGIDIAKGQWIVFLDADDILEREYLEKCMSIQKNSKADIVYTDMQMFGAVDWNQKVLPYNRFQLRSVNFIHNSSLYRASMLRAVGGYSPEFSIGFEDWELNLKLSKITKKFIYLPESLLLYRRHEGASRDNNAQQKLVIVVKLLEKTHPELYNLRYYWWLESKRALDGGKAILKYPYLMLKHAYFHTIMALDRHAKKHRPVKVIMNSLRSLKKGGEPNEN